MRLPNAALAVIDRTKLIDYCLSPVHPEGRHKARVFRAALGITQVDAEWLATAILNAITDVDAHAIRRTEWGMLLQADVVLTKGDRSAQVRTGWIVRKDNMPALTTCYIVGDSL